MKILHTSDWHLGRSLYGRKRYDEFTAFLSWLIETIQAEKIDALLVAGDIFDTSTPSNRAQQLYYRFLCQVATTNCRHVVIIAGNHDSPSFLNAPRELLLAMNVHVVGAVTDDPADELIVLSNNNQAEAIVCAVPYLRDRDIRIADPGETIDDKNYKLIAGLKNHYADVCLLAEQKQSEFKNKGYGDIPILAMGHLFTAGGKTIDGDGVRELYVGSLAHVSQDVFPQSIDYLALGHLHVPQLVANKEHIRYSGSPIPMGFGEAEQQKKVITIDFNGFDLKINEIDVPCFQKLARIVGNMDHINTQLEQLKTENKSIWLEIEYNGTDIITDLREQLEQVCADTRLEILRIKNRRVIDKVLNAIAQSETLDDLDPADVFNRCMDAYDVPVTDRADLSATYSEIVKSIQEQDPNAQ